MKYKYFIDKYSGWLRVKKTKIEELDIANSISSFSFEKGQYVYLDDLNDMQIFIHAKFGVCDKDITNFFDNNVDFYHSLNVSNVRSFNRYNIIIK